MRDPPESHASDAFVRRARDGDHDAYAELVRAHQAVAIRVAAYVGDVANAEDVVQESFAKAYVALPRFDLARPFRPWFLTIVANEARTRGRSQLRADSLMARLAGVVENTTSESLEDTVLQRLGATRLHSALSELGEQDQSVLALRFVLDLGEAETAAVLGCRRGTVKSRTSRALGRLRSALEERDG